MKNIKKIDNYKGTLNNITVGKYGSIVHISNLAKTFKIMKFLNKMKSFCIRIL